MIARARIVLAQLPNPRPRLVAKGHHVWACCRGDVHLEAASLGALRVVDDADAALYALLVVYERLYQLHRLEGAHDGRLVPVKATQQLQRNKA